MKSYLISIIIRAFVCILLSTDWGRDKMADIFPMTYLNVFSWMKCLNFDEDFTDVLQLTIFPHWFRWWFGARRVTIHYLNQWWLVYLRIYASLGLSELTLVVIYKYRDNYICVPYTYGTTTWEVDSLVPGSCVCKWVNFEFTITPTTYTNTSWFDFVEQKPMQRLPDRMPLLPAKDGSTRIWLKARIINGTHIQLRDAIIHPFLGRDYHRVCA